MKTDDKIEKEMSDDLSNNGYYLENLDDIDFESWVLNFDGNKFEILQFLIKMQWWKEQYKIYLRGKKK